LLNTILGTLSSGVAASTSSYESIASSSPTSGTSITLSSIPSTYKHLQLRYAINTGAFEYIRLRFNGDSGSNYTSHVLWARNGSTGAEGYTAAGSALIYSNNVEGTTDNYPNVGIIDIIDYADTSKYKTFRTFAGSDNKGQANPKSMVQLTSGAWLSTSAINSITIISGTYSSGTQFSLYGIKGA